MHFIDDKTELAKVWDIEFQPDRYSADQTSRGRTCCRVDHLAQTMNYEEMLTWVLFYISIFDTEREHR